MNKKTNTVIMWLIGIGLVLGMILTFTPNLGIGAATQQGEVVMRVNGEPVTDLQINQVRNANPIYYAVTEGEVGADLELLAMDAVITQELLRQAAASQRVSNGEVRDAVNAFREDRGVAGSRNDSQYLSMLASSGFDDATFRDYMREQLRQQKWEASIIGDVDVTDEEVTTFYNVFRDNYRTDERIVARVIAVADQDFANELRTRVLTGEPFAELAAEHSLDRADRAGALGATAGSTEPQPTGRAALPTAVANAAFGLRAAGLTSVVTANNMYWIVQVEEYLPPEPRPFEEVAETVRADALASRQVGLVSAELERLLGEANIEMVGDSEFTYNNYLVAEVGSEEIRAADLARATYGNPEVQQFLAPSLTFLITDILKPQILDQLIDRTVAYVGAAELDGEFFGTEQQVAQQALNYVARDVVVTDEDVESYYAANIDRYTQSPEAQTVSFEFDTFEAAEAFRDDVLSGTAPTDAAQAAGARTQDLGIVRPGLSEPAIDSALFQANSFEEIDSGTREISDVLFIAAETADGPSEEATEEEPAEEADVPAAEDAVSTEAEETEVEATPEVDADVADEVQQAAAEAAATVVDGAAATEAPEEEFEELDVEALEEAMEEEQQQDRYVVLVADRTSERVRPLDEVRDLVSDSVRAELRNEAQLDWIESIKAGLEIQNHLEVAAPAQDDPFGGIDFSPEDATGIIEDESGEAEEAPDDTGDTDEPAEDTSETAEPAEEADETDAGDED